MIATVSATSPHPLYFVQLRTNGCRAECFLNDVPVLYADGEPESTPVLTAAVGHLLLPGRNSLELVVEPGDTPNRARRGQREVSYRPLSAAAVVKRFSEGDVMGFEDGVVMARQAITWDNDEPAVRVVPQIEGAAFDMGPAFGPWAWQSAPRLDFTETLVEEVESLLAGVEQALIRGDVDFMLNISAVQRREVARAFPGITDAFARAALADVVANIGGDPTTRRRQRARRDFRLVAGARMLQVIDVDWSSSLRFQPINGDPEIPLPMMLARIDGRLQIVR